MRVSAASAAVGLLMAALMALGGYAAHNAPPSIGPANMWGPSIPVNTTTLFQMQPRTGVALLDEELYLGTLRAVESGSEFYTAQRDMFNMNPGRWDTRSPLAYRQPLTTYLWILIGDASLIGIVWALIAAASLIPGYLIAFRLTRPGLAIVAPLGLAILYGLMIVYPPRILYTEVWAAPLLVGSCALCGLLILNLDHPSGSARLWPLAWAGAGLGLLALMIRELALFGLVIAVIALLSDERARRQRLWLPWFGAIVCWLLLYAHHVARVRDVSRLDPPSPVMPSYFHPGSDFLAACVRWVSTNPLIVPLVILLVVTACVAPFTLRTRPMQLLVGGLTVGTVGLLVLIGTPGVYANGAYTGYWGFLFLPLIVMWAPLGLRVIPAARGDEPSTGVVRRNERPRSARGSSVRSRNQHRRARR